jgi:membrane fusion protein, multidrug efflux system
MRTKASIFLTLLAGLLLPACKEAPKSEPQRARVAVTSAVTQYETVPSVIEAPATIQARNRIAIASQINGFVATVKVSAGDTVGAGQVLATLDARDAESQKDAAEGMINEVQAALEEARKGVQMSVDMRNAARANSELAASTLARFQKLSDARSVSPQELDEAKARRDAAAADLAAREAQVAASEERLKQVEARVAQARAQSRRADVMVGWTVIKAPAAGRIVERPVDAGSAIFPGSPIFVMESVGAPQVLADLPSARVSLLRVGLEVRVRAAGAEAPVTGRVSEIIPLSNPAAHTVQFKVDLPATFAGLTGQYATVDVPAGERRALLVPRDSMRESGQLTTVFVVDGSSRAQLRLIKVAPFDAQRVEVLSGIEPGEKIVTAPGDALADGSPLEIRS